MTSCIAKEWLEAHPEFSLGRVRIRAKRPDMAHPYPPGTGPEGQSCGTCAKLREVRYSKKYFKCSVQYKHWTDGPGTDIRKKDPACLSWEPRIDKVEVMGIRGR